MDKKNGNRAWKEKILNQNMILLGLKIKKLSYKCDKKWSKPVNELIKNFPAIFQFCNGDVNKFVLLLRKGVYLYEDMDSWGRSDETTIPAKESFYSELYLENTTDKDYARVKKVWDAFGIKNRGEYHDLYFQSDTLLLHQDQHGKLV